MTEEKSKDFWVEKYVEEVEKNEAKLKKENKSLHRLVFFLTIFVFVPFCLLIFINIQDVSSFLYTLAYSDNNEELTNFAQNYTAGSYGIHSADKLSHWIHENIDYSHRGNLKASEIFEIREGVCKEKAILLISFMRSLGKLGVEQSTLNGGHAIAKIYDSEGYFFCDPTNGNPFANIWCDSSLDCPFDSWCNTLTYKCESKKSLSFCWRPC